jgi:hypothetical protein
LKLKRQQSSRPNCNFQGIRERRSGEKKALSVTNRTITGDTRHTNRMKTWWRFQQYSERHFYIFHMCCLKGANAFHTPLGASHMHIFFVFYLGCRRFWVRHKHTSFLFSQISKCFWTDFIITKKSLWKDQEALWLQV